MRAVSDTSVIVSTRRSRHGASNRLLQFAYARSFQMLATPALFLEYEEVLGRDEQRAVHGMSPERTIAFLFGIAAIIEPVRVYYRGRPPMHSSSGDRKARSKWIFWRYWATPRTGHPIQAMIGPLQTFDRFV